MKTNYLAVCIAIMAALCGCGRSPEAEGKAMSEKLTAAQLFEVTMQNALMAVPNVGSLHAQRYEQFCQENGVPLNKPILDLLKKGFPANEETKQELFAYARKNIAKYAMPCDIEFRETLPTTLVGKVAYRELEEEELARRSSSGE